MKVLVLNANGERQWIPEHWLDHPVLGEGFTRISGREESRPTGEVSAVKKTRTRKEETNA